MHHLDDDSTTTPCWTRRCSSMLQAIREHPRTPLAFFLPLVLFFALSWTLQPQGAWAQTVGAPADAPVRLVVPSIGVDANIETFNLNPDLSMPVPETGDVAAWYTFGGGAGGPGNAVLAGHVDLNYHRAVFYELGNVAEGDNVWLQDAGGAWFQYRVIWTVSLVDDSAPIDQIAGYTDIPSLTLITCSGGFDRTIGRYVERRIVRAELVAPADQAAP